MNEKQNDTESNALTIQVNRKTLQWGVVGLLALVLVFSPPYITDKIKGFFGYGSLERVCYREWGSRFKDPWTAYVESSRVISRSDPDMAVIYPVLQQANEAVELTVRAKNEFGAYAQHDLYCPMKHGMVDHHETFMWRLNH